MDLLVFITLIVTGLGAVDDPFAASMLRPPWALAARAARLVPDRRVRASRTLAFLAARTRHVDAAVTAALDDGFGQVLTVGAGYDSRPWRLARPGVRFVELDHPGTQADKRHRAPSGPGPPMRRWTWSPSRSGPPSHRPGGTLMHRGSSWSRG